MCKYRVAERKLKFLFFLFLLVIPALGYPGHKGSRGARIGVPKPIPGFNSKDYPSLSGMLVAETRDLAELHPGRGLVLWVKNAVKTEMTEYVSCPDSINGSNYRGQIYVSLLDVKTHQVLQTVFFDMKDQEGSSLPFRIQPGLYSVHGKANSLNEMKTVLLDPVKVDSDPTCEEYAFFENPGGCFCPIAFPFGYDAKEDKIFRFKEVVYELNDNSKREEVEYMWNLFFEVIKNPGEKNYDFFSSIGHGSDVFTLHRYKYDRSLRTFYGISVDVPDNEKNSRFYFEKSGNLSSAAHHYLDKLWKLVNPKPQVAN